MPRLKKLLSKFNKEERRIIEILIKRVISLDWRNLDIKKLSGHQNIFRIRKGKIRILFIKEGKDISILTIERRNENTYKV
ncbi:MAG: hypothetical protein Q8Q95_03355 [bacterium]|nr:hypothetical protein [bacterium]